MCYFCALSDCIKTKNGERKKKTAFHFQPHLRSQKDLCRSLCTCILNQSAPIRHGTRYVRVRSQDKDPPAVEYAWKARDCCRRRSVHGLPPLRITYSLRLSDRRLSLLCMCVCLWDRPFIHLQLAASSRRWGGSL